MTVSHSGAPSHGSKGSLWTGSILSIILTVIPFWLVMADVLQSGVATALTIFVLAMVQIVVHVSFFLHVDRRAENGWMLLSFIFTAIIVGITIIGSIWVMYHLDTNMMPMGAGAMGQME